MVVSFGELDGGGERYVYALSGYGCQAEEADGGVYLGDVGDSYFMEGLK